MCFTPFKNIIGFVCDVDKRMSLRTGLTSLITNLCADNFWRSSLTNVTSENSPSILAISNNSQKNRFQVAYIAMNKKGEVGSYSIEPGFTYMDYLNGKNKEIISKSEF